VPEVGTCSRLKSLIRAQLREDITSSEFDVGFVSGNNVVSIRSEQDLAEIWSNLLRRDKVLLWCDGLARSGSRKRNASDSDSDESDIVSNTKKKARD